MRDEPLTFPVAHLTRQADAALILALFSSSLSTSLASTVPSCSDPVLDVVEAVAGGRGSEGNCFSRDFGSVAWRLATSLMVVSG